MKIRIENIVSLIEGWCKKKIVFARPLLPFGTKYFDFFTSLKNYFSIEDYLFVHAGFNDKILNPFQDTYSMVWESQVEYLNPLLAEKTIIHGHRPITVEHCEKQINDKKPVINIDTGCVYKEKVGFGKLTAIELYSKKLFSV